MDTTPMRLASISHDHPLNRLRSSVKPPPAPKLNKKAKPKLKAKKGKRK